MHSMNDSFYSKAKGKDNKDKIAIILNEDDYRIINFEANFIGYFYKEKILKRLENQLKSLFIDKALPKYNANDHTLIYKSISAFLFFIPDKSEKEYYKAKKINEVNKIYVYFNRIRRLQIMKLRI